MGFPHLGNWLMAVTALLLISAAPAPPEQRWLLSLFLFEQSSPDAQKKVLAEPTLIIATGKPFSFVAGGTRKSQHGGSELSFGTRVRGVLEKHDVTNWRLTLQMAVGNQVVVAGEPGIDLVRTDSFDLRLLVASARSQKIPFGHSQWCNVQIEPQSE